MRPIDADAIVFDYNGLAYIGPYNYMDIAKYFADQIARQPTLTPTNEPLTLEELREMDGEPVWVDTMKRWGIVRVCGYGISVLTKSGEYDVTRMKFYRRPPEGEED